MAKVMGTMLTIWGFIMGAVTFFNYLNSPANIGYNGNEILKKYSLIDSGITFAAVVSILLFGFGVTILAASKEPRSV